MKHLSLWLIPAVVILMAPSAYAAKPKHAQNIPLPTKRIALTKDLVYSCSPQIRRAVEYGMSQGQDPEKLVDTISMGMMTISGSYRTDADYISLINQRAETARSTMIEEQNNGTDNSDSALLYCAISRFSQQIQGAKLLTKAQ